MLMDPAAITAEATSNIVDHSIQTNVDAAYSTTLCTYGLVVSDSTLAYYEALSGTGTMSTPLEAYILAILEALRFLSRHCFTSATISSDS